MWKRGATVHAGDPHPHTSCLSYFTAVSYETIDSFSFFPGPPSFPTKSSDVGKRRKKLLSLRRWGTSLVVRWLRLHVSNAGSAGSIPGQGTKIPHAAWHGQKKNFFLNLFYLFIYFWLHWVFVAACGLSLVAERVRYSLLQWAGFSLRWLLLLWSTGSRLVGSVVVARGL